MNLNWSSLTFSPLTRAEIAKYTRDLEWQSLRTRLIGVHNVTRFAALREWLIEHNYNRASQVQVSNYVNALKRGGLI